jgi:hypothetical protein
MEATALTELDVLNLAFTLFEYSPLPDQLSSHRLDSDYGLDAALDLSGRIIDVFNSCNALHPKISACNDVELLRKLVCIIQTSMKIVEIFEDWSPNNAVYEGRAYLEEKAQLLRDARRIRRIINPTFSRLIRRISFLTQRPAVSI